MNRTTKKVLSLVLVMIMVISSVPMMSFAGVVCDTIGHSYDWIIVKDATCTQTGTKTQKCSRLGCDSVGKTETIDLIPHSEVSIPANAPTCDTAGNTEGKACKMCGLPIVPCETLEATGHKAVDFANRLAPEHLEMCVENPLDYIGRMDNAGSVFLGNYSPEPLGDYFAGPNHVLPTSGTARFFSPLSVDSFIKKSSFIYYTEDALRDCKDKVIKLADTEGLTAHANSIRVRFE